ncbi:iron (metal) dependent repressor, DtxR family [Kytococcus aerolatus]|uniref:Iron (Metal) dependent repressor, DtxR family n=1 Tax=Kytococcus aerolatus TaxID=592308 RepID=A0A212TCL8_9MICO|nr:metal-dependent transcriptional regulator [Kytococcus aerolatus]SNC63773.1 iron (metal) dependent repressor, DtxR family [Kytococcus aerolatus]
MSDLIDTTEMYLKTIYELDEEGIPALRARIAERLGHSGPTVSQTIARMERDGLVTLAPDRRLHLTDEGRTLAVRIERKHRLAERLLVDIIGLEWEYVHEEACRWEHVMSDRVERKILALLENSAESPYGNPIPGLAELGGVDGKTFRDGVEMLTDVVKDGHQTVFVRRIGEPVQVDGEALALLTEAGVLPGERVEVRLEGDRYVARGLRSSSAPGVSLPRETADHVFVSRVGTDTPAPRSPQES